MRRMLLSASLLGSGALLIVGAAGCGWWSSGTAKVTAPENDPAAAVQPAVNSGQPAAESLASANAPSASSSTKGAVGSGPSAADDEEPKSPIVKHLLDALNSLSEGTSEEHEMMRDILRDADQELADSLGENSLRRIQAANNTHRGIRVGRSGGPLNLTPPPAEEAEPAPPAANEPPAKEPAAEPSS